MPVLTLKDGGHIHYESHGSGPPLLLVTGLGGLASFWDPHTQVLARHFRVVTHDHRGTGRSSTELERYSVEQMTDDVLELMDALDIQQASLIGHSTGGAIGQTLAIDHPHRLHQLILSSTWPGTDAFFRKLFETRAFVLKNAGTEVYSKVSELFMYPPSWFRDNVSKPASKALSAAINANAMLGRIDAIIRYNRNDQLKDITAPTLVICARDDQITPIYFSENLAANIPGAVSAFEDAGGHYLPVTQPERYREHVLPFLKA